MKILLAVFGCSLLAVSSAAIATTMQASQNSQKSQKASAEALERMAAAHGKEQLARADMVGEGTVTVFNEKLSTILKVTLLRNAEYQSQRILLQQSGKMWDGRADTLTEEGKRALDFLETQYMRGPRKLLKADADAVVATTTALTLQEEDGLVTSYFLDSLTSRLSHFEFEFGQQVNSKGRVQPNVHSISFSDYRSTDGIATPFHVEHETNGNKQEELQLTTVRYLPANTARKQ